MIATVHLNFAVDIAPVFHVIPKGYDISGSSAVFELRDKNGNELYAESSVGITAETITITDPLKYADGTEIAAGTEVAALRVAPDLLSLSLGDPDYVNPVQYRYGLRVDDAWTMQGWLTVWPDTGPAGCIGSPIALYCGPQQIAVTVGSGPRGEQGIIGPAGPWQATSRLVTTSGPILATDTLVLIKAGGADIELSCPDPVDMWDGVNGRVITIARIPDDAGTVMITGMAAGLPIELYSSADNLGESVYITTTDGVTVLVSDAPFVVQTIGPDQTNSFVTVEQAEAKTFVEPAYCYVQETGYFYRFDSTSVVPADGYFVLTTASGGRLITINGVKYINGNILIGGAITDIPENILHVKTITDDYLEIENTTNNIKSKFGETDGFTGIWHNNIPTTVNGQFATNGAGTSIRATSLVQLKTNAPSGVSLNSVGDVGFGTTAQTARNHSKGSTADYTAYITKEEDAAGTMRASTRCDGQRYHEGPRIEASETVSTSIVMTKSSRSAVFVDMAASGLVVSFPINPDDDTEIKGKTIGSFSHSIDPNGELIDGVSGSVTKNPGESWFYKYKLSTGSWWRFG